MTEKEKCGNRKVIVLNYYQNGCPFDFNLELHKIETSIENYKASMELAEKYNSDTEGSAEVFLSLLSELRIVKDVLKGSFDIIVINQCR